MRRADVDINTKGPYDGRPPMPIIKEPQLRDRVAMLERPRGMPVMHQSWDKVLFMHWKVPLDAIREKIPSRLEVDTYDNSAWVTVTPLDIFDVRPPLLPALPYFSRFHELNVRTYVHRDGVPGVWFFSLDANSYSAVGGARFFFELPYVYANMSLIELGEDLVFESQRQSEGPGKFTCTWRVGRPRVRAEPGTLDFFLVERYCLYTSSGKDLYRCRIHHQPWPLFECDGLTEFQSTMLEANGLPELREDPLLHCGGPVYVDVWGLERTYNLRTTAGEHRRNRDGY